MVPAFSSKGFGFYTRKKNHNENHVYSEIAFALQEFTRYPVNSLLVSAYDLHFGHFDYSEKQEREVTECLSKSRIVFIDSGGYELSSDFDLREVKTFIYSPRDEAYGKQEYRAVLDDITQSEKGLHTIVSNFDHESKHAPLKDQIMQARDLFSNYKNSLKDFLIKPWTSTSTQVDPNTLSENDIGDLGGFDIIGVTEKELGKNPLERFKRVAVLRKKLDEANISAPIHVWGGLDPIFSPLYYFVGAEIFDGISWLRYAYRNGVAINRDCYSFLEPKLGIEASQQLNFGVSGQDNLAFLSNLTTALQRWANSPGTDFDMFEQPVRDSFKNAYETLKAKITFL